MTRRRGIKINNYYDDGADHVGDLNTSRTHSHKSLSVMVTAVIMTRRRGIKIYNYYDDGANNVDEDADEEGRIKINNYDDGNADDDDEEEDKDA